MAINIPSPTTVTATGSSTTLWDNLLVRQSVLDASNPNYVRNWQINNGVIILTKGVNIAGITFAQLAPILIALVPQLSWPPVITVQPVSGTVAHTNPISFSITATSELPGITYQWQSDLGTGGVTWTNLTNTSVYNNVTTNTLTVTPPTSSPYSGYKFRCIATNASGSTTSATALLTVT